MTGVAYKQDVCGILEQVPYLRWNEKSTSVSFIPTDLKTIDAASYRYSIRRSIIWQHVYSWFTWKWIWLLVVFISTGQVKLGQEQLLVTDNYGPKYLDGIQVATSQLRWAANASLEMLDNQMCIGKATICYRIIDGKPNITSAQSSKQVMRVYEVKVEDYKTGELIRDYIPAIEDGSVGLKDKVTGIFCQQYDGSGSVPLEYGVEIRRGRNS